MAYPKLTGWIEPALKSCAIRGLLGLGVTMVALACIQATEPHGGKDWDCSIPSASPPESAPSIGCIEDYRALADRPYDESMPGAFAVKVVIDRADGDRLYFLDTRKSKLHYPFVLANLSGNGKPLVRSQSEFVMEYHSPDRRFILATLAWYERPGIWTWELTPSDNAGADLIALAHGKISEACFCGKDLSFHATSLGIEAEAAKLPASVKVVSTPDVYAGIDYQALNFASGIGRLVFTTANELKRGFAGEREIIVSDSVPNALPMAVGGLITGRFQTPLSHVNVLAQDRGIPNMGLRGALADSALRALEGKWVKLTVDAFGYSVTEATEAEGEAWRSAHGPTLATIPAMDTALGEMKDVEGILDMSQGLAEALKKAIPAYGGLTSHYSAYPRMDLAKAAYEPAFGIPVLYYVRHMQRNGLNDSVDRMLADPKFKADPAERARRLDALREAIRSAPMDAGFLKLVNGKLDTKFPGTENFRFASSTNAGDIEGLTGAGLYASRIGGRNDPAQPLERALLDIWAGTWDLRAFEERSYRGIDHKTVGMGALVQPAASGAKANGVGITANPFDAPGYEPGFYINVQAGEAPVTLPDPSAVAEQILYHYILIDQPIVLLARSNRVAPGTSVLTKAQTHALGTALLEIQSLFGHAYGKGGLAKYAMHVEFGLGRRAGDPPGADPVMLMKDIRPYGGWR
jgi:hypothetical protein